MSYQALARKYRPQQFSELMGQTHVVTALSNALANDRLHHAYLFTGTRGVGKTTIARIFAKSLNCINGVTAEPCGQCQNCVAIEEGRFVDLVEVDAASRTKVEDTREILDNVQYSPTQGRYKVYLIDEVHMLSRHSFNALLKTLEEPPPHVKFLLATTDPQKLPVTILSRCLQFSLKALTQTQLEQQLSRILDAEQLNYEATAISQLALAANGSVRDALSLTDQAIAQGNGQVQAQIVRNMLGLLDEQHISQLVTALVSGQFDQVMAAIESLSIASIEPEQALVELLNCFHQIALIQVLPQASVLNPKLAELLKQIAAQMSAEQVQLFYQILLKGRQDLPFAANPRSGLEMTLLRLIAFQPVTSVDLNLAQQPQLVDSEKKTVELATPHAPLDSSSTQIATDEQSMPVEDTTNAAAVITEDEPSYTHQEQPPAPIYSIDEANSVSNSESSLTDKSEEADTNTESDSTFTALNHEPVTTADAHDASLAELAAQQAQIEDLAMSMQGAQTASPEMTVEQIAERSEPSERIDSAQALDMVSGLMSAIQTGREQPQSDETPSDVADEDDLTAKVSQLSEQAAQINQQAVEQHEQALADSEPPPWQTEPVQSSHAHLEFQQDTPDLTSYELEQKVRAGVTNSSEVDLWSQLVDSAELIGLQRQLAIHSTLERKDHQVMLTIEAAHQHLLTEENCQKVQNALSTLFNSEIQLLTQVAEGTQATPFHLQQGINQERLNYAVELIDQDPNVQALKQRFNAQVVPDSVKPL
ncbi:DNA polymerase III subunit gamma/tau [Catenovulum sp. SM1970]|uniref:DNA polymerase III subunit gamma/tau n=1 Tax=Marinifaba aquimaris TaxID=2741323 RepID=UPI0015738EB1|nr:DNA polymerase III subunit gamma/tau [Marinifaba aquimaris]NTS75257.1 DNA polymerase III subunit gamma/tau [Marinifaba aquimaris]